MAPPPRPRRAATPAYPALGRFLDGYLHQDYRLEHESPVEAARAFRRDATAAQEARVAAELERFLAAAAEWPEERWQRALVRIGGAWRPEALDDLRALLVAFRPHR